MMIHGDHFYGRATRTFYGADGAFYYEINGTLYSEKDGDTITYCENKLDNALFNEVKRYRYSEDRIKELVRIGANINAVDNDNDSVLTVTMWNHRMREDDYSLVRLVIELGAEPNHLKHGLNDLWEALAEPRLRSLLLQAGADVNCISSISYKSYLDIVDNDLYDWYRDEIRPALIEHGAKTMNEIDTEKAEEYVLLWGKLKYGLLTLRGNVRIEKIVDDTDFVSTYYTWFEKNSEIWRGIDDIAQNRGKTRRAIKNIEAGKMMAEQIKKRIGSGIVVKYKYMEFERDEETGKPSIVIEELEM